VVILKIPKRPPRALRLRVEDLVPDGVKINLDWDALLPGASAFIPCINVVELVNEIREYTDKKGWVMEYRTRIEDGKWGVRFWRMS
jgi:hypothetical protein